MSGLEPIAALSLACNILQVVGVGREAVRLVRQVYRDGTIDPALKENAGTLEELSARILPSTTATSSSANSTNSTPQDKQLASLADKCQGAARDLQEEVNFLNGPPTKAKLVATLKIAAKTTWRKRRLERNLANSPNTNSERSVTMDTDLLALDAEFRAFIDEYRKGHTDTADLTRKHITMETNRNEEAVKSHVTERVSQAENSLKEHIVLAFRDMAKQGQDAQLDAKRRQLLQSLKFDRMNERRNLVSPSHPFTFSWMLQDGSEVNESQLPDGTPDRRNNDLELYYAPSSWDSFSDWLRSTETVYWISGKPGSGKTTLIKYLLDQPRLQEYLNLWRPDSTVISHFFWRPGTTMQQSIRGLFCSVLYQLLLGNDEVVEQVLSKYDRNSNKDTETDWSGEELQSALHDVVNHYPKPIAIFLDGLDEVLPKDGVLRLLEVIHRLRELNDLGGKIKMCLGSRREPLFCKQLGIYPQLRLEQLNRIDLQHYGNGNINIPLDYQITMGTTYSFCHKMDRFSQERLPSRTELKEWLVDSLVGKAQGVFLWLCLTATTVTKALHEGETLEDLEHRIESLPGELSDLYADMWARMNHSDHFKIRAASYLQLAIENDSFEYPLNPFVMMVATTLEMAEQLLQSSPFNHAVVSSLIEACEKTRRDVVSRCAGLLACPNIEEAQVEEVKGLLPWHEDCSSLIPYVSRFPAYSFLHRTARDFLTDTEAGQIILSWGTFPGCRAYLQLSRGRLEICRLFNMPLWCKSGGLLSEIFDANEVGRFFLQTRETIRKQTLRLGNSGHDKSAKIEISRLLLVCEQLFNDGYLGGAPTIPPMSLKFEQNPLNAERYYIYHGVTVNRRDEFLIEAASHSSYAPDTWNYLLPIIESRNVDSDTLSQLLVHACSFGGALRSPLEGLDARLKAIETILGWGASPYCKTSRRNRAGGFIGTLILTYETPFKKLMMSVWDVATNYSIDNSQSQRLLSLIGLFVAHGADLREEVHVAIEVEGGLIEFRDLWRDLDHHRQVKPSTRSPREVVHSPEGSMHVVLIMGCPASAIITKILKIWQLEPFPPMGWLAEAKDMSKSDVGKGHTIAVVDVSELDDRIRGVHLGPTLFLGDMFPLRFGDSLEDGLQELAQLAGNGLHGVALKAHSSSGDRGVLSHVLVPLEVQERAAHVLEQLRSTDVPAIERRREVRLRLGVCTPLEEEEWQNNTLWDRT
ncbi:NACHT domain-containing protein [Apiospora arundinis]